ncbi:MAG: hypothetical protein ACYDAQ_09995 [Mycobacteriales bacterium]
MDEGVEQLLLGAGVAVGDDLLYPMAQGLQLVVRRAFRAGVEVGGELEAALTQFRCLVGQGLDALAARGLGQRAGFEGEQVALDGLFGLAQLAVEGGQFVTDSVLLFTGPVETQRRKCVVDSSRRGSFETAERQFGVARPTRTDG